MTIYNNIYFDDQTTKNFERMHIAALRDEKPDGEGIVRELAQRDRMILEMGKLLDNAGVEAPPETVTFRSNYIKAMSK